MRPPLRGGRGGGFRGGGGGGGYGGRGGGGRGGFGGRGGGGGYRDEGPPEEVVGTLPFLFPCSLLSRVVTESPSVEIRLFCALLNKLGNQESDHFWTLGLFPPSFLYDLGILGFFIFVSAL